MAQRSGFPAGVAIECDVAVVGAGPVGLMTANLLGAAGVGFEADPASMLSGRDLAILDALGAQIISLNALGPIKCGRTLALPRDDSAFVGWARRYGVRGVLVRPDRFIAARLNASADLAVLNPFAIAPSAALPHAA